MGGFAGFFYSFSNISVGALYEPRTNEHTANGCGLRPVSPRASYQCKHCLKNIIVLKAVHGYK